MEKYVILLFTLEFYFLPFFLFLSQQNRRSQQEQQQGQVFFHGFEILLPQR